MSHEILKGVLAGAGAALLLTYLYKKNKSKIDALAGDVAAKLPQAAYPLHKMSTEKLAELKDSIEDVLAERNA